MKGSHAPSLRTLVRRTLMELELCERPHILCACSGGPDSNAMLSVLGSLRGQLGFSLSAVGVDHGLRQAAGAELAIAAELARSLAIPFAVVGVAVAPGSNLMARARAARYQALRAELSRVAAQLIATAHTADDRAETVLLRLLRGSGARGLAVLPPRDGDLLRPLVRARRSDVELHLARHGVASASDPSNLDTRFVRVRVRLEVLPVLSAINPRVVETLCRLADELGANAAAPGALAELGRRQRELIAEGLAKRGKSRVRTADSKEVLASMNAGELVVTEVQSFRARRPRRPTPAR